MGESELALDGSGVCERLESSASQLQGEVEIACHPSQFLMPWGLAKGLRFGKGWRVGALGAHKVMKGVQSAEQCLQQPQLGAGPQQPCTWP